MMLLTSVDIGDDFPDVSVYSSGDASLSVDISDDIPDIFR